MIAAVVQVCATVETTIVLPVVESHTCPVPSHHLAFLSLEAATISGSNLAFVVHSQ